MRINTNVSSITAQEAAQNTGKTITSSLEKLSTGFRINKASDDASGLAIADKLRTQATSINQGISNGNSAVSLLQIADKSMGEQSNILDTIKSKLIQANTDTTSADGREAIRKDIAKLLEQLDNIAEQTNYNGNTLLQAGTGDSKEAKFASDKLSFQIGETNRDIISNAAIQSNTSGLGLAEKEENTLNITAANSKEYNVTVAGVNVSFTSDSTASVDEIHAGLKKAIEANSVLSGKVTVDDQKASGSPSLVIRANETNQSLDVSAVETADAGKLTATQTTDAVAGVAQVWNTGDYVAHSGVNTNSTLVVGTVTLTSSLAAGATADDVQNDLISQFQSNTSLSGAYSIEKNGTKLKVTTNEPSTAASGVTITATKADAGAINGLVDIIHVPGKKEVQTATIVTPDTTVETKYNLSIGGENISFTAKAGAAITDVHAGLMKAFEANETLAANYDVTNTAGASFVVTAKNQGVQFTLNASSNLGDANLKNTITNEIGTGESLSALKDLGENGLTKESAAGFQSVVDAAITDLNGYRGDIGSTQNQVESAVRNLMTQATNVKAAESIIRDVDYAAESANFNKQNIISQAGSYAISQANAVQQNVLRLLQ